MCFYTDGGVINPLVDSASKRTNLNWMESVKAPLKRCVISQKECPRNRLEVKAGTDFAAALQNCGPAVSATSVCKGRSRKGPEEDRDTHESLLAEHYEPFAIHDLGARPCEWEEFGVAVNVWLSSKGGTYGA